VEWLRVGIVLSWESELNWILSLLLSSSCSCFLFVSAWAVVVS